MSSLPWKVSKRGDFIPYVAPVSNEERVIQPPWPIQERLNVEEESQKEQGHGWHGYFEDGSGGGGGGGAGGADAGPPPVDLTDTSWSTSGQEMNPTSWEQCLSQMKPDENGEVGATINPHDGTVPDTGFQVAGVQTELPYSADNATMAATIDAHVNDPANAALYARSDMSVGLYLKKDPVSGAPVAWAVEPSQTVQNPGQAALLGVMRNQYSIWNNAQAAFNNQVRMAGQFPDGTPFNPASDKLPSPLILTGGTGDYGLPNPNYDPNHESTAFGPMSPSYAHVGDPDGTFSSTEGSSTEDLGLTQTIQDRQQGALAKIPGAGSTSGMRDQIVAAAQGLNAQQVAFGLTAYPRYHNECPEIVKDTANTANPITPLQAAGLISATSARTQLGISMAAAHYIARAVATDQVINLPIPVLYATNELTGTPVVGKGKDATGGTVVPGYGGGAPISSVNDCNIQNGVALSQQPNLTSAAQALMKQMVIEGKSTDEQWGTTKDGDALTLTPSFYQLGTGNAIEIAMGHVFGDPTTPVTNAILGLKSGAMKQPNFANNINDPNDPNFATMDAIMTRVVTGGQSPGAFGKLNETPAVTENGVTWKGGCYPCEVDALKEATPIVSAMLGFKIIMPEAQAMLWGHEGDQTEGYVASGSAQGIASKSGQGGSHEVNPTITDVPLSDMSDLDITNVGTLYAPAPASVTPPPAPVDVTTLRAAVAIIQQGPAGSALGTITTAGLDRVNSPLVAGQYGAANETFKYSLDTEKACKADVTDRLSASMTASTKDIVALAGLAEHPGLATPFSMQPDSPAATLWSAGKEREAAVATLVSAWAGTSNDSNALSLAIQSAAEKEFGLQDSMRWGSVVSPDLNSALSSYLADKAGLLSQGNNQAVAQEFVRAQYTDTQQMLKDQGVATVLLYRAQGDDPADLGTTQNVPTGPNDKGITTQAHDIIQTAQMRPISSWSTSLDVAIGSFGSPYGSLLTAQIPASQIMSTARTGVGCLNEHEMTVIGNVSKVYREDAADYGA